MISPLARFGWVTFGTGSFVFTLIGVVNGDWWVAFGGLLFVVGCIALYLDGARRV